MTEESGSNPAPSLHGPVTSRKVFNPLSISLHWDAVWYVFLLLLLWLVSWIGLGVSSRVSSDQVGQHCAWGRSPCVGSLVSWPLMGKVWSPARGTQREQAMGSREPWAAPPGPPLLYTKGMERATCQVHMGSNSSSHSFSKYLLSCHRPVTVLGIRDTAVKKILFKELGT